MGRERDKEDFPRIGDSIHRHAATVLPDGFDMELSKWGTLIGWYWVGHNEQGDYDMDGKVEAQINDTTFLISYEIPLRDRQVAGPYRGPEEETTIVNLVDLRGYKYFKDQRARNHYLQWLELKKMNREEEEGKVQDK